VIDSFGVTLMITERGRIALLERSGGVAPRECAFRRYTCSTAGPRLSWASPVALVGVVCLFWFAGRKEDV